MASSADAPPPAPPAVAIKTAEEPPAAQEAGKDRTPLEVSGDAPPIGAGAGGSGPGEGSSEQTLELADELYKKGSQAIDDGNYEEAVDCLSRALEIRAAHHGELSPECVMSYYKYGYALLYKAQAEANPLVEVPKNAPKSNGEDKTIDSVDGSGSSKTSVGDSNKDASVDPEEGEEDGSDEGQENDNEESDDDNEETAEAEEEDSDLDMAWKMLELARTITEKSPEDTLEKVNILAALAEVSAEREEIETSLNDYLKALSMLERLVEPDNRRIVELNLRICLVLEMGSRIEEAVPYCQKAISVCNSRLKRLKEDSSKTTYLPEDSSMNPVHDTDKGVDQSSKEAVSNPSSSADETELLRNILSELEEKLEDLQQALLNPKPVLSEIMKMLKEKSTSAEPTTSSTEVRSFSMGSSQVGVNNGGFDSPTISTVASNGGITDLGVVGRGVKRATVNPSTAEPPAKKLSLGMSAEKDESSISEITNSTVLDAKKE